MSRHIAVLAGDGIGPEVMQQALRVLDQVNEKFNLRVTYEKALIGGAAYDEFGAHFPAQTREQCQASDAILFGSVGGPVAQAHLPKWQNCETNSILALRKTFQLSTNLRPAKIFPGLEELSPLKLQRTKDNIDMLVVRELVGDIYFGEHRLYEEQGQRSARDVAHYTESQIRTAVSNAFKAAQQRRNKVTSVDKANVLATSKLWRDIVNEVSQEFPTVQYEHMLVDNCAMQLLLNPSQFDVIVSANLFGDILSDAASAIPGSLGLMPSASLNTEGFGLYEPAGGSAPDIAGQNKANPIAQILSLALLLRYSLHAEEAAHAIENAVLQTLQAGYATQDIFQQGKQLVGTCEFTDAVLKTLG